MPGTPFHLMLYQSVIDKVKSSGKDIGIFFITYKLAPHAVYPAQLRESVEALRWILKSHSPSDVILAGDSAGGNLALGVMSHISHPHSEIGPLELSEPLSGLMVMAPWVTFKNDWGSSKDNAAKDCITAQGLEAWSDAYLSGGKKGTKSDHYIEAVNAPVSWWEDAKVSDTLVIAGGEEILKDGVLEWAENFKKANPNTTVVVGQVEGHDEAIYGPMMLDTSEKETGKALKEWVQARL